MGLGGGSGLKAKCTKGAMALGIGTVAGRAFRFLRVLILARILLPDDFGKLAIIMVAVKTFEAIAEVGIKQSVIQNKMGCLSEYLNVAWWMQAIRGLGLFLIAIIVAPLVSSFYEKPEILVLLRFSCLAILFRGFISPRAHVLEKEFKFGRAVLLAQGSSVLGTFVTIILALVIKNVWALVIGLVLEAAFLCILSYIFAPFLPRFSIDRKCLSELMRFARGMFGLPILTIIAFQADVIVLGKMVTFDELGMYYMLLTLTELPIMIFSMTISPVLLPAFSEKQDNKDSLVWAVLKISRSIALIFVPLVLFISSCSRGILHLAYGSKYTAVALACAILAFRILLRTEAIVLASIYLATGKPHLHRFFVILRAIIIAGLIYPSILYFGLLGAASVVVLGNSVALLAQIFWCRRIIELDFFEYIKCYVPGILVSIPGMITAILLPVVGVESSIIVLFISAAVFGISMISGTLLLNRRYNLLSI